MKVRDTGDGLRRRCKGPFILSQPGPVAAAWGWRLAARSLRVWGNDQRRNADGGGAVLLPCCRPVARGRDHDESGTILVLEDDPTFRSLLVAILEDEGYGIVEEENGKQALIVLRRRSFDWQLLGLAVARDGGAGLFRPPRPKGIAPPFILLTAFGTVEEAVSALKEGVTDFLTKPLKDPDALRTLVRRTLENRRRELTLTVLRERETAGLPPEEVVFAGAAMAEAHRLIGNVADTPASVLISGESGTGKELVAWMIHLASHAVMRFCCHKLCGDPGKSDGE